MDKHRALEQLIQAARGQPLDERVPLAFEKRIMAELNPEQRTQFERLSQQRNPRRIEEPALKGRSKKKE